MEGRRWRLKNIWGQGNQGCLLQGAAVLERGAEPCLCAPFPPHPFRPAQLMSLLALALRTAPEAAAQLEAHLRLFRRAPLAAPAPAVRAAHAGWLSRQYSRAAELLSSPGLDLGGLRVSAAAVELKGVVG